MSLSSISSGASDWYLKSFAEAVKAFGHGTFLSFGHEMNGAWYAWGSGHSSPAAFVTAWRHVVQVFRDEGVTNVKWVWTVTSQSESPAALQAWWPGSSWVDYVGIDGYYYTASATYDSVFGQMLRSIKTFSSLPDIITEVGIGPNQGRNQQIKALYADATAAHFSAIVWFDEKQQGGPYNQDWRLEDDPSALGAFTKAVQKCCMKPVAGRR